ncbi:MAG: alpha-2-macroglobulin family protein, partial [Myxococcota bacterium]
NQASHITPVVATAAEFRPKKETTITVSEKDGRRMVYTLAVVDEGLLGLTRFKTPDLHAEFNQKEALSTLSWDMFDYVIGAYGAVMQRVLGIGGDGFSGREDASKTKRFPPVAIFLGPFRLEAGKKAEHKVAIPEYLGEVRVMVVAGADGAYGFAEKQVPVREDLMIYPGPPRITGPDEEIDLPVTVFVTKEGIRQVTVGVESDDHFRLIGETKKTLSFERPGDQVATFRAKTGRLVGMGRLDFKASGGGKISTATVNLPVLNRNPESVIVKSKELKAGESWMLQFVPHGLPGTNRTTAELSTLPPLNLEERLGYLVHYPHGCLEQTTSAAFPQLFLPLLVQMDRNMKSEVEKNVNAAISKLGSFQMTSGAFSLWPGGDAPDDWLTSYAGHFMLEASRQGYKVPGALMTGWTRRQRESANRWTAGSAESALSQAYRLFTLALAGSPDVSAMNRLRAVAGLKKTTAATLAAAYSIIGQAETSTALLALKLAPDDGEWYEATYGSSVRDKALTVYSLTAMGKRKDAKKDAVELGESVASERWMSTQTTAFALAALTTYYFGGGGGSVAASMEICGKATEVAETRPIASLPLTDMPAAGCQVKVRNNADAVLYVRIANRGTPPPGAEVSGEHMLRLSVSYTAADGTPVDQAVIEQGKDIVAKVSIENLSPEPVKNIALSLMAPSGVEITNPRFTGEEEAKTEAGEDSGDGNNRPMKAKKAKKARPAWRSGADKNDAEIDYQDFRDDRVLTYLYLGDRSKLEFKVLMNAAYKGHFYMPAVTAEAMYDATKNSLVGGRWITIK